MLEISGQTLVLLTKWGVGEFAVLVLYARREQ